ncbi:hypothetical protein [Streptomyces sp. NPDC050504]|uniref:hypothetical protein n=1 Tax=Streptomyces sp. NPDC050504 TaxID=3365618 RepID=UPI0037BAD39A
MDPVTLREGRADLALLVCVAALVALLTASAAAAPPLLDRLAGRALASRVDAAQRSAPGVEFSSAVDTEQAGERPGGPVNTLGEGLPESERAVRRAEPEELRGLLVRDSTRAELQPARSPLRGESVALSLLYADDGPKPREYVQGRPPGAPSPLGGAGAGAGAGAAGSAEPVEAAFSTRTRDALKLRVGERLTVQLGTRQTRAQVVVTGFFAPGPSRLGREVPLLHTPLKVAREATGYDRQVFGLAAPEALETLQRAGRIQLTATWRYRLALRGDDAVALATAEGRDRFQRALLQYQQGVNDHFCGQDEFGGQRCTVGGHTASAVSFTSALPEVVGEFGKEWRQARAVVSFALASLIAVSLATCVVTALLAVRRRAAAHRLQRARGASALGLAAIRAAQTAPFALCGAALGFGAAHAAAPEGASGLAYGSGLAVAVCAWLVLPVLTYAGVRDTGARDRGRQEASDGHRSTRAARRITAEALVVLLAAGGVVALRSRGLGTGPDPVLAAVPALLGLATVVLLVRCYPLPVRAAARWCARRRGAVPLIALSRAAKDAPARGLALLVLVLTLATAVFGSMVAGTVSEGRRAAAGWESGADASFVGARANPEVARRLARAPGVRHTVTVDRAGAELTGARDGGRYGRADLVGIDAAALRRAAPDSVLGRALEKDLTKGRGAGPGTVRKGAAISVLAESGPAPGTTYTSRIGGRSVRIEVVGTLPGAAIRDPAVGPVRQGRAERLLVADRAAFELLTGKDPEESALLLYGSGIDGDALRALVPRAAPGSPLGELRIKAEALAAGRDDGVLAALSTAHTVCALLAALLAFLALVLDLLLSAPERGRTAAQLRTLGLGARDTGALQLLQLLPLVLAAAAGGAVLGALLPVLLEPALKLREFTGGPADPAPRVDHGPAAVTAAAFVLLVAAAAAAETWLARRRGLGRVLRVGETGEGT